MLNYENLEGQILGTFELQRRVHLTPGMIATYAAQQVSLQRRVALQVLSPERYNDDTFRKGFLHAAELMASLEHPNITPVHDVGVQDRLAYIVTRYISAGNAYGQLADGLMTLPKITTMVKQIGSALDFIHVRGKVHGDPSSGNLIFDESDNAYIADFHVAGLYEMGMKDIGVPLYSAPEKLMGEAPTPASDQYALAFIAYHMLTGQKALPNDVVMFKVSTDAPFVEPQQFNPDVPQAVNPVLLRALAHDAKARYPTVLDFAREFEEAMREQPKHLFVSYSRRDAEYAQQLKEQMQHNGFEIWIDEAIEHGDQWFNEINEAIKTCAAFLVIMTPESEQSEWVHKEILLAKRYDKPIFPLLLSGNEFPILIDTQFADVREGHLPNTNFHRRLRQRVFGQV